MTNLEYYKNEVKLCGFLAIYEKYVTIGYDIPSAVDWFCEEHKEPLLNDDEKEYFYQIQEALDINIKTIRKLIGCKGIEYITIRYSTELETDYIRLPSYKANKRFENLELEKTYTAEEVGL